MTSNMNNTTLDAIWKSLADTTAEVTRMTDAEAARLYANKVAKLVGLLPYLAGCEEAQRTALSHLATWVIANRSAARTVFDHKAADDRDPLARLETLSHFVGGDKAIIDAGMRRLALCMVSGYARDKEKDQALGGYNPINAKTWDESATTARLGAGAAATTPAGAPGVDGVLSAEAANAAAWQG